MRKLKSIKWTGKVMEIVWSTRGEHDEIEHSLQSPDNPSPEFVEALKAFRGPLCGLLELPPNYADTLVVTGIKLSHSEKRPPRFIVRAFRELEATNAPFAINSPLIQLLGEEEAYEPVLDVCDCAERLMAEAEKYIEGDREQAKLPLG